MIKPFSFRKAIFGFAMLLLCGIFMQSCTEEMPILTPLSGSPNASTGIVSTKSIINLNINNTANTISNLKPNNILFTHVAGGASLPLFKEYFIVGDNGNQTNNIVYTVSFHTDTIGSKKFVFETSQLVYNKKTYTTFNISGKAKFAIDALNDSDNTTSGSFGYYVYDDILNPTDSVYVSGSFNILK